MPTTTSTTPPPNPCVCGEEFPDVLYGMVYSPTLIADLLDIYPPGVLHPVIFTGHTGDDNPLSPNPFMRLFRSRINDPSTNEEIDGVGTEIRSLPIHFTLTKSLVERPYCPWYNGSVSINITIIDQFNEDVQYEAVIQIKNITVYDYNSNLDEEFQIVEPWALYAFFELSYVDPENSQYANSFGRDFTILPKENTCPWGFYQSDPVVANAFSFISKNPIPDPEEPPPQQIFPNPNEEELPDDQPPEEFNGQEPLPLEKNDIIWNTSYLSQYYLDKVIVADFGEGQLDENNPNNPFNNNPNTTSINLSARVTTLIGPFNQVVAFYKGEKNVKIWEKIGNNLVSLDDLNIKIISNAKGLDYGQF